MNTATSPVKIPCSPGNFTEFPRFLVIVNTGKEHQASSMSDSDQLAHGKALLDLALQNPAENEPALAQRVGQTLQFGNEHTNEVFLTKAGEILVRFIQPVQ